MTEKEKIAYAKSFIDKLANGVNPLDGTALPETDIVNNVRISRCLFYVSDLLNDMIKNNGRSFSAGAKKLPFEISEEQAASFNYSYSPIHLSEIAKRLSALAESENMRSLSYDKIASWLLSIDILEEYTNQFGKKSKRPTERGKAIGISVEQRTRQDGEAYNAVLYNREAQQFIVDNIRAIIEFRKEKKN